MNKKGSKKEDEPKVLVKNAADLQRLKIEKLMKNPDKEIMIPNRVKEKRLPPPPEFIRNVMGSSAGAGSGEFHVYRHLRRKEYARQKFIQQHKEKVRLDEEYHEKLVVNQQASEDRTAKKRAKRLRKKEKYKNAKKKKTTEKKQDNQQTDDEKDEDNDEEEDEEQTKNDMKGTNDSSTEEHIDDINTKED